MTIKTTTHLNFRGQAGEALAFYQSVFGGRQMLFTYADAHAVTDPAEADQVIWGEVASEDGFHVMAFDVPASRPWDPGTIPVFVSVRGGDAAEVTRYWEGLCEGGVVLQPLGPAGFSPLYGMVRDRFGITWVLDVQAPQVRS
ncbi:VOC family protein [Aureimonas phyllosphaerae]|uniref:PhnB protein n=1 Tax=Aureimonas phyllosphaerae TaxID=1166078 RepID=A0A7W6BZS4_9HYPH|nr:VOC family protein [Aureimonas phyllosphaerae]MBB3938188.1 PhnB protein [Aureimonas phyllosphaerae]MBB3962186.1 PhnB protein [Aureimonas phyllosphaerae]SFF57537.1 PhnB protein [Aureimonas phyllosphaerae]